MHNHESRSAILFRHWIKANPYFTCALEMKDTRGAKSLPFSEVSQAQLDFAIAIKTSEKGVLIRVQATVEGVPDYIYLRKEPAIIPIKFPDSIELIDVESFILEKNRSKRKSLTQERAKAISIITIDLKNRN